MTRDLDKLNAQLMAAALPPKMCEPGPPEVQQTEAHQMRMVFLGRRVERPGYLRGEASDGLVRR